MPLSRHSFSVSVSQRWSPFFSFLVQHQHQQLQLQLPFSWREVNGAAVKAVAFPELKFSQDQRHSTVWFEKWHLGSIATLEQVSDVIFDWVVFLIRHSWVLIPVLHDVNFMKSEKVSILWGAPARVHHRSRKDLRAPHRLWICLLHLRQSFPRTRPFRLHVRQTLPCCVSCHAPFTLGNNRVRDLYTLEVVDIFET